jgi:hypothetical protein
MRYDKYPYIQAETRIEAGTCQVCLKEKPIKRIEWRVDWFQGNCEFEDICQSCFDKRNNEEKRKRAEYEKKMEPIWQKKIKTAQKRIDTAKKTIEGLGLVLKTYDNGQWSISNKLDWWTTTGTAIERQSKKRHYINLKDTQKLKEVLIQLT